MTGLALVLLYCGHPVAYRLTNQEVAECRKRILLCAAEKRGPGDGIEACIFEEAMAYPTKPKQAAKDRKEGQT